MTSERRSFVNRIMDMVARRASRRTQLSPSDSSSNSPAILIIAENGGSGGIGRYCADLAEALGGMASVVCLCSAPCSGAGGCWLAGQCAKKRVPLLTVSMPPKAWKAGLSALVGIWKRTGKPLIHVNGARGNSIALASRLTRTPFQYVTTAHGVLGLHSRRNALYRFVDLAACLAAKTVMVVSADTGRRLTRAGIPRRKILVVPNGLSKDAMEHLTAVADRRWRVHRTGGALRLGFLGRLSPEKGTHELLRVSQELYAAGAMATVTIGGDGPDRKWLETESRILTENGFMRFEGVVQDAADFLGKVDVLIIPSRNEGMPYVLLEGMAAGCAVVAYRVGGIPEVINHPSLGTLVPYGDADALFAALADLCGAPAQAAVIGKAAAEHVQVHYSLGSRLQLISRAYGMEVAQVSHNTATSFDSEG